MARQKIKHKNVLKILSGLLLFSVTACDYSDGNSPLKVSIGETEEIALMAKSFRNNIPDSAVKIENNIGSDDLDDLDDLNDELLEKANLDTADLDREEIDVPEPPKTETASWSNIKGISENGDEDIAYYVLPKNDAEVAMMAYKGQSDGGNNNILQANMTATPIIPPVGLVTATLNVGAYVFSNYMSRKAAVIIGKKMLDMENLVYETNKKILDLKTETQKKLIELEEKQYEEYLKISEEQEKDLIRKKTQYENDLVYTKAECERQLRSKYFELLSKIADVEGKYNYSDKMVAYMMDVLLQANVIKDNSLTSRDASEERASISSINNYPDGNIRSFIVDLDVEMENKEKIQDKICIIADRIPTDNEELCIVILKGEEVKLVPIKTDSQFEIVDFG